MAREAARPRSVTYALTPAGRELAPVVVGLFVWGRRHLGAPVTMRHRACGAEVEVAIVCPRCGPVPREACERAPHPDADVRTARPGDVAAAVHDEDMEAP